MTGGESLDETAARRFEAVYQTPDIVAQRHRTLTALELREGERVLDIGAGPGLLVKDMAAVVGPSGHVTGLEINDSMLAVARRGLASSTIALRAAGFRIRQRLALALLNPEYDPGSYSVANVGIIGDFVSGRHGLTPEEVQAWRQDLAQLGTEGRYFFSLNRYLFLADKPART